MNKDPKIYCYGTLTFSYLGKKIVLEELKRKGIVKGRQFKINGKTYDVEIPKTQLTISFPEAFYNFSILQLVRPYCKGGWLLEKNRFNFRFLIENYYFEIPCLSFKNATNDFPFNFSVKSFVFFHFLLSVDGFSSESSAIEAALIIYIIERRLNMDFMSNNPRLKKYVRTCKKLIKAIQQQDDRRKVGCLIENNSVSAQSEINYEGI